MNNTFEFNRANINLLCKILKNNGCPECFCCDEKTISVIVGMKLMYFCNSCNIPFGLDDSMNFFDIVSSLKANNYIVEECKLCGNVNPGKYVLVKKNSTFMFECKNCHSIEDDSSNIEMKEISINEIEKINSPLKDDDNICDNKRINLNFHATGEEQINNLEQLKPGDHIKWNQFLGYWHHAIVEYADSTSLKIIHFNGPIKDTTFKLDSGSFKGKVICEEKKIVDSKEIMEELWRVNYKNGSHDPITVIENAKSELGKTDYNLLFNNCEHFATWCKTNVKKSSQVCSFEKSIKDKSYFAIIGSIMNILKVPIINRIPNILGKFAQTSGAQTAIKASNMLSKMPSLFVSVSLISTELVNCTKDLSYQYESYNNGSSDKTDVLKISVKRICQTTGVVCFHLITMKVPLVNGVVGSTLSALIGEGIGSFFGRNLCTRI